MKNLHLIPTDKPSRLYTVDSIGKIDWSEGYLHQVDGATNQHIYITSPNEDINENDYIITKDGRLVEVSCLLSNDLEGASKVVLTTDQDLIKNGVQEIDDEFLEWFIKNPSCETAVVEKEILKLVQSLNYVNHTPAGDGIYLTPKSENLQYGETLIQDNIFDYKIIIPKKEPKQLNPKNFGLPQFGTKEFNDLASQFFGGKPKHQCKDCNEKLTNCTCIEDTIDMKQKTLEEVIKKYLKDVNTKVHKDLERDGYLQIGFINGTNWQKEQADNYAIEFLKWCESKSLFSSSAIYKPSYEKLLQQFKKEKGL